ncbi:MAG: cytochrome c biogenesis protein CcdA [Candidatus Gastranaerophilales bacterium]|nr:cytochrome c biogenesis protein CcdA [Candidatus Gastranaerophilales bacterium]
MDSINHFLMSQMGVAHSSALLLVLAFLGGIVASASPCSLGLLPVVIGYVGGNDQKKDIKLMVQVISFILGIAIALTVIGVTCAMTGQVLGANANPYLMLFLASLILVMGLHVLEILYVPMPTVVKQLPQNKSGSVFLIPVLIGIIFALGTTPCSTPILASIMAFASLKSNLATGAMLFFTFALGQGVILLVAAFFTNACKKLLSMHSLSSVIMKSSGVLLVLASFYLYYKIFAPLFL